MKNKFFKNKKNKIELTAKTSSENNNILFDYGNMPVEIILQLASFLKFNDVASLRKVNRHWYDAFFCEVTESGEMRKSANRFTLYDPTIAQNVNGYYFELLEKVNHRRKLIATQPSLILNLTKLLNEIQGIMFQEKFCSRMSALRITLLFLALLFVGGYVGPESFFAYKDLTSEGPTVTCTNETVPIKNSTYGPIEGYRNETICQETGYDYEFIAPFFGSMGLMLLGIASLFILCCCMSLNARGQYNLSREQLNSLKTQLDDVLDEIKRSQPSAEMRLKQATDKFNREWYNRDRYRYMLLYELKSSLNELKEKYTRLRMFQQPRDEKIAKRDEIRIKIVP